LSFFLFSYFLSKSDLGFLPYKDFVFSLLSPKQAFSEPFIDKRATKCARTWFFLKPTLGKAEDKRCLLLEMFYMR